MSFIPFFGIMKVQDHEGVNGNVRRLKLSDDYKTCYVVVVGDGLSQMRARAFDDDVEDSSHNFGEQHEMIVKTAKILK